MSRCICTACAMVFLYVYIGLRRSAKYLFAAGLDIRVQSLLIVYEIVELLRSCVRHKAIVCLHLLAKTT